MRLSLNAGRPVIAWGVMPGAAVIAGCEDHGDTLVGWGLVFDAEGRERDRGGYVRMRDRLQTVGAVLLVGEKAVARSLGRAAAHYRAEAGALSVSASDHRQFITRTAPGRRAPHHGQEVSQ